MPKREDIKKILIIGSGPIIIGQAAEFDYAGTQACLALKEEGYEVVLVNSNPDTIMTDTTIADKVYMIHSVDTEKLAATISKEAIKAGRIIPVLIEVNVAKEDTKYGVMPEECEAFIRSISSLPGIIVKGLMTIAPFVENGEDNRVYFQALKQLSVDIMQKNIDNVCMDFLSMGMSGDYTVAIEEGANLVRVGTNIFGERNYSVQA